MGDVGGFNFHGKIGSTVISCERDERGVLEGEEQLPNGHPQWERLALGVTDR